MLLISCILEWVFSGTVIVIGYLILIRWQEGIWNNLSMCSLGSQITSPTDWKQVNLPRPFQPRDLSMNNKLGASIFVDNFRPKLGMCLNDTDWTSYFKTKKKYSCSHFTNQQAPTNQVFQQRSHGMPTSARKVSRCLHYQFNDSPCSLAATQLLLKEWSYVV